MESYYDLLIIGGVAAGMSAASQARRENKEMSIALFEKSDFVSYGSCGMPYYIGGLISDYNKLIAIDVDMFINKRNIQIMTGTEATAIDFKEKKVMAVQNGKQMEVSYGKLMIATGAKAIQPPIPGAEQEGVFVLRNLNDGIRIKEYVDEKKPKSVVLVGGGFIGLELAENFRGNDIETTIVERLESVAMSMDTEIRDRIIQRLENNGVTVKTGTTVEEIKKDGSRIAVHAGGEVIVADLVVLSVGIAPNTDFLKGSELEMTDKGAIIVNEKSETNMPDVYSGGDCATVKHLVTGKNVYMPLGPTANKQGRVAGLQAAGVTTERFPGIVGTQLVKVFDLEVGKTGLSDEDAAAENIPASSMGATWKSRAGYCPKGDRLFVKLTINPDTREIIGGQIAGTDGAAQRTNVIATAIASKMKVEDFAYLDLGYAPPFSPVWDALLVTAQKMVKR